MSSPSPVITSLRRTIMDIAVVAAFVPWDSEHTETCFLLPLAYVVWFPCGTPAASAKCIAFYRQRLFTAGPMSSISSSAVAVAWSRTCKNNLDGSRTSTSSHKLCRSPVYVDDVFPITCTDGSVRLHAPAACQTALRRPAIHRVCLSWRKSLLVTTQPLCVFRQALAIVLYTRFD